MNDGRGHVGHGDDCGRAAAVAEGILHDQSDGMRADRERSALV